MSDYNDCCCEYDDPLGNDFDDDAEWEEFWLNDIPFWYSVVPPLVALAGIIGFCQYVWSLK